jgi:N-carbamoyl-L-amino-acid hydrolase
MHDSTQNAAKVAEMAEEIDAAVTEAASRSRVSSELIGQWTFGGFPFGPDLVGLLRATAKELGTPYLDMRSQAGHDAYSVA